jgi:hypothetical protein
MQTESILEKGYDLLKYYLPLIERFPKQQRFLLGDRIQILAMTILELLSEAYYLPSSNKKERLNEVNIKLEMLRYFNRLCYENGYYSSLKFKEVAERLLELGRMNGGWIKSLK